MFNDLKRIADALESIAHDLSDMRADQKIARDKHAQMLGKAIRRQRALCRNLPI